MAARKSPDPDAKELEAIETELLLRAVQRRYGYDFSRFDAGIVSGAVRKSVAEEKVSTVTRLTERLLRDPRPFERFLARVSGKRSRLFEPPPLWRSIRRNVVPFLRTYPSVRIWQANACAEDVYSLSILLEEDLPRRTRVYATALHDALVEQARSGVVPTERMGKDAGDYRRSGGRKDLAGYFRVSNGSAHLSPGMLDRVVFASHNLASDAPFNHFHAILARDLLGTFDEFLRDRVFRCFHESLLPLGFLGLGPEDRLRESPFRKAYRPVDKAVGLYQKVRE